MAEIDENQLVAFRNLSGFVQKALANPKTRRNLLQIQKEIHPEIAVPELDAADPVLDELKALRTQFEEDKKARDESAAKSAEEQQKSQWERQWLSGRKKLADSGVNPEGIDAVEKLMTERSIADHEAGWALFEKMNPPPPAPMTGSSRFNWFQDAEKQPDLKQLLDQDYDGFLGNAVDSARREFRSNGGNG